MTKRKTKNQRRFNGAKLKALLNENGMTYEDLEKAARDSGTRLTRQNIGQHIRGQNQPRSSIHWFYAHIFGLTMEDFWV